MPDEAILEATGVSKALTAADGTTTPVNRDVSLTLSPGEFVSIVGPSGGGKTTLLRTLSGLAAPDTGDVRYHDAPLDGVPERLAIVFQEYNKSLFPWQSVGRNVRMAIRKAPRAEAERRIAAVLAQVGLADVADRYPWELSGGMQQRVALARAMVCEPEVIVMDEPFASVDALTRTHLEDVVLRLWADAGFAALLVTHDIGEAVYLSDRVLVLSARPSTITSEIEIDLPRPRDKVGTRALPRYQELYAEILGLVESAGAEEVLA